MPTDAATSRRVPPRSATARSSPDGDQGVHADPEKSEAAASCDPRRGGSAPVVPPIEDAEEYLAVANAESCFGWTYLHGIGRCVAPSDLVPGENGRMRLKP